MRLAIALATGLNLVGPGEASDSPKHKVAVVPLQVEGELGLDWQRQLSEGVLEGLARGDFEVLPPDEVAARAPRVNTCRDSACLVDIAEENGATYVVRPVIVAAPDRNYDVAIELIDARHGQVAARVSQRCEVCGVHEVRELVADQGAALRKKLDDLVTGPAVMIVSSTPDEARVLLDGVLVGQTPLRREVVPGRHRARAEKDGYAPIEREFLAVPGVEEPLEFELDPLPDRARRIRPWGWAGLGVGIAALVPGVTFMALDEQPAPGDRCAGDNVDSAGNCRFRYDTMVPGIALTVSGAAITALAVAVLVITRKRDRSQARNRPTWVWTPSGMRF